MSHENIERRDSESIKIVQDSFYTENNMRHLRRGMAQLNAGKAVLHEMIDPDALMSRIGSSIASQTTL